MSAMDELQVGAGTPGFDLPRLGEGWRKPLLPLNHEFHRPSVRSRAGRGTFVIGLSGAARSGKNTVAEHLVAAYGRVGGGKVPSNDGPMNVRQYALADALKIETFDWFQMAAFLAKNFDGLDFVRGAVSARPCSDIVYSDADKLKWVEIHKAELRRVLQEVGTAYRRKQDADYWIDRLLERIAEDSPQVALLTDVRFANEIAICHANVKVEMIGQREDPEVSAHVSEREWRGYEFWLNVVRAAKGDLGTLKRESERVFESILARFHVM